MTRAPKTAAKRILDRDRDIRFPEFLLLKASAGSGKTHALSLRFVQFLLSPAIAAKSPADLRNILAVTFTRNAAREMKARILSWLKLCRFGDAERSRQILDVVSLDIADLPHRAEDVLEDILSRYTDFQVETIDSFMASVFRTSAIDLGFPPHFEIVLDNTEAVSYAFSRYMRRVAPGTPDGEIFEQIADLSSSLRKGGTAFPWDPTALILESLRSLYRGLAARDLEPADDDLSASMREAEKAISRRAAGLKRLIEEVGLERSARESFHSKIEPAVRERRFMDLIVASFKTVPVRKPRPSDSAGTASYDRIVRSWESLESAVAAFKSLYARHHFRPVVLAYRAFAETLETFKRSRETVFIEDIHRRLAGCIEAGAVPDIYFRLGDRIFHYLIDEFQDTSPIQWTNLLPLIENSLSLGGSLFAVGDTKQAIYGFRNADYRIMKDLEDDPAAAFPSVPPENAAVRELETNYRSRGVVQDYVRHLFLDRLPASEDLGPAGVLSGLTDFSQEAEARNRGRGYVEAIVLDKNEDDPPEKAALQERVRDLRARGFAWSDIAVLTYRNDSVAAAASWLNEIEVPFIPYSNLDIRTRKVASEILALLRFLDSPPDDLAFSAFLLGDVFAAALRRDGFGRDAASVRGFLFEHRAAESRPLYTAFRRLRPELWERYFERLFRSVGYYPLYDLVALAYRVLGVFDLFPGEEAALVKLLESAKTFESPGAADIREFLTAASDPEKPDPAWTIDVPRTIDAVRVMSVHKAKGLGFPAVILLQYAEPFIRPEFILAPGDDAVRVLKITKELAASDPELAALYEDHRMRDTVDRLNALYVAMTRAEEELHVIGVKGSRGGFPFELLDGDALGVFGEKTRRERPAEERPEDKAGTHRLAEPFDLPPNTRPVRNFAGVRRGNLIHDVLSRTVYIEEGWRARIEAALREGGEGAGEAAETAAAETAAALERLFSVPPLSELFSRAEGRRILNEFTVCDAAGRALRMDRVVLDPGAATVIDYKTGGSPGGERPVGESWGELLQSELSDEVSSGGKSPSRERPERELFGIESSIGEKSGGESPKGESSEGKSPGIESLVGEKSDGESSAGELPDAEGGDAAGVSGGRAAAIASERRDERAAAAHQVREYMRILRELYPGHSVRGLVVWVDRGDVEEIA